MINLRAGGEDSAFSNTTIIHQLREQVSQLQAILQEKEENEKTAAQKLAMYQNQLHAKNNEVATLKDQLQSQVSENHCYFVTRKASHAVTEHARALIAIKKRTNETKIEAGKRKYISPFLVQFCMRTL